MALTNIHVVDMNETPEQQMIRLGIEHNALMSARVKAYRDGLQAIHDKLVQLTNKNEAEQSALLNSNPELLFLVK